MADGVVQVKLANLVFELGFELIAGAAEFCHRPAQLPSQPRQLPRPEYQQGQEEDENHLSQTEVHASIINGGAFACHRRAGKQPYGGCRGFSAARNRQPAS